MKPMQPRTKKIIVASSAVIVLGVATILVTIYYEEIRGFLGYSPKTAKSKDRITIVTTGTPLPNAPALKEKEAKKLAKAKEARKLAKAKARKKDKPNRCAKLPFSYEFKANDPNAKNPFRKHFWGPNFGCLLAGAYDRDMPGPIPQVRAELERLSPRKFKAYKVRLEKIMRRYVCRTFDYYLSTCKEVLDSRRDDHLSVNTIRLLLQKEAHLYDVGAVDRFRQSRVRRVRVTPSPGLISSTPPADTDTNSPTVTRQHRRRLRVSLRTRRLPPQLCGSKLKPCPKP